MHPELFTFGRFTLYSYGLALAIGFAAGILMSAWRAPRSGIPSDRIYDAALPVLLCGLAGAKLMYLGVHYEDIVADPGSITGLIRGGFVFYGSLIGGTAGALVWLKRAGISPLAFGDAIAPGLALAQGIGRIGCWMNGCCYGSPVSWGWSLPCLVDGVPRHPVQLYEAGGTFAICALLLAIGPGRVRPASPERDLAPSGRARAAAGDSVAGPDASASGAGAAVAPSLPAHGRLLGAYLVLYSVLRFATEVFRDDPRGGRLAGLSVSQSLSIVGLVAGAAVIWWAVKHARQEEAKP